MFGSPTKTTAEPCPEPVHSSPGECTKVPVEPFSFKATCSSLLDADGSISSPVSISSELANCFPSCTQAVSDRREFDGKLAKMESVLAAAPDSQMFPVDVFRELTTLAGSMRKDL